MSKRSELQGASSKDLRALEKSVVPYKNATGDIRFHLVYPNHYWVGMSNLGFQAVYDILARDTRVIVERGFLPEQNITEKKAEQVRAFESSRLLSDADIVGFALSFETDYPNLLALLANQGLLFSSHAERDIAAANPRFPVPLLIAGGTAVTLNPEPVAHFLDAIVIGEAEELLPEFINVIDEAKRVQTDRLTVLRQLAHIEGVYVPRFYTPVFHHDLSLARYDVTAEVPARPRRRFVKDLSKFATHSRILTPETEFKSMFLTETGRGCEMGCRFCVAGYIYRPVRKRSEETIAESIKIGLVNSQAIGFVGASVSSHKSISKLAKSVADQGGRASLSSIMSQKVSKELAASISESEYKTVALAPEAGSNRLRRAAGKRVTNEQIVQAATELAEAGIRGFKLYFIAGLPTETDEDLDAVAELAIAVRNAVVDISKGSGKAGWVALSVNPFIPKASTPFQWEPMLDQRTLEKKIDRIKKLTSKIPNLELRFEPPKESYFQALLSRGDRRVGQLLHLMHKNGESWKWLMKRTSEPLIEGVPPVDYYVSRRFDLEEQLPWEVVDSLIPKSLLKREAMRAHFGEDWKEERPEGQQNQERIEENLDEKATQVANSGKTEVSSGALKRIKESNQDSVIESEPKRVSI